MGLYSPTRLILSSTIGVSYALLLAWIINC
jgi:hypothetical protein